MDKRKVKLSIIILSWNTKELLKNCLDSLFVGLKQNAGDQIFKTEVIVVDNGSTDGSVEMCEKYEVDLIKNKTNLGYSRGNNLGIKRARGQYIMLLNSDTVLKKDSLMKLVDCLNKNKKVDIVGPRLLNQDGSRQANCGKFPNLWVVFLMLFFEHWGSKRVRWAPSQSMEIDWLMGAAFMARKEVFEKIGGLDEEIFMYMEEVEWFYRANKAGFKSFCLTEAEIFHLGRGSAKGGKSEPILNIYKGIIYFFKKHKSSLEQFIVKLMLKLKAALAFLLGTIKHDDYLVSTYEKALKIN